MSSTTLVASLTSPPSADGDELRALHDVGYLEVRADLVGDIDADWLRERFGGRLVYTLRSRAEGGAFEGGRQARRRRIGGAAATYDLLDLEAARDVHPELLSEIAPEQRLVSWHGPATHLTGLRDRADELTATAARFYKLIPTAQQSGDGLRVLDLLRASRRNDLVAFAAGEIGAWTRLVAPRLGSPLTYGSVDENPAAPGQPSIARLRRDYGLPRLRPVERLYGIAGRPVAHSLSPRLHNGAYRALGIPALYVPFHLDSFGDFWLDVVEAGSLDRFGLPLQGLSVTSPYKEVALTVAGAGSPRAHHIGAANTLVRRGEVWEAEITDPEGVLLPLERHGVALAGARAAVVGCGGAGRAAAYGLEIAGARVTLVNRSPDRGRRASQELSLPLVLLADFDPAGFAVVVHATGLGHRPDDPLPFDVDAMDAGAAVVDLVYDDAETPLVAAARRRGLVTVTGQEVLLAQALRQFRLMTDHELSEELARELLGMAPAAPPAAREPAP